MSRWPMLSDYAGVLQNPQLAFKDAELKQCRIKTDANNLPLGFPGQFAVVYQATLPAGDRRAIRAFTRNVPEREHRYHEISSYLDQKAVGCLVRFKYFEKGIKSDGKLYPLVTMDWVRGKTLFEWVRDACHRGDRGALGRLCERWVDLVQQLSDAQIAHGDLQHANVMVTDAEELKLVDYDCMCVPQLVGKKNLEIGVIPYQHWQRDENTPLTLDLDNFSAIVIFVALRALAAAPNLWQEFVDKAQHDKLLFRKEDFDEPTKSDLLRSLRNSPDKEIGRFLGELLLLYKGNLKDVPPLIQFLYSFDKVRSLLKKKDFDEVANLIHRMGRRAKVPADLVPLIKDAEERVRSRKLLEEKIEQGDEAGIQRCYNPKMLDDYPAAKQAVAIAKQAALLVPILEELNSSRQRNAPREFETLWNRYQALLRGRKSAQSFVGWADRCQRRNKLCDEIAGIIAGPSGDVFRLAVIWNELKQLGSHPELQGQVTRIELLVQQQELWTQYLEAREKAPAQCGEERDRLLVGAWNDTVFGPLRDAQLHRSNIDQARQNLRIVEQIGEQVQAFDQGPSELLERKVSELAVQLPKGYSFSHSARAQSARGKLRALDSFRAVVSASASTEAAIADAWQMLTRSGGELLASADQRRRAGLAQKRIPLLDLLKQLPQAADSRDQRLLSIWQESLLDDCPEAKVWGKLYQQAVQRESLMRELRKAISIADRNDSEVTRLSVSPLFAGYPLPQDILSAVTDSRKRMEMICEIQAALEADDAERFVKYYDGQALGKSSSAFLTLQGKLENMVRRELVRPERIGLTNAFTRQGVQRLPSKKPSYKVRWSWPEPRFSTECVLTVTREKPVNESSIETALLRQPVFRKQYEAGSGSFTIHPSLDKGNGYIAIWAVVTLGAIRVMSGPLVLGRIDVIANSENNNEPESSWPFW